MEKIIEFKNVNFKYPSQDLYALSDINLSVNAGDFVLVCGKSGSGKSTLLRQMKRQLAPHGTLNGSIKICGIKRDELDKREESSKIGFVMQNPDNQIVTDKVWHEIAFGLENLGYENSVIRRRTAEISSFFGIDDWFHKSVSELSGGQKQLLNLASVMVMQPDIILLDEPTAQLDPIAAENFISMIGKINSDMGTTVVITEHRIGELLQMADNVAVMDKGRIVSFGTARECAKKLCENNSEMFAAFPTPARVYASVKNDAECPITVSEGRAWLEKITQKRKIRVPTPADEMIADNYAVNIKNIWFRYDKNMPDVIRGLNMKVHSGEIYAVLGSNGAGKSTVLSIMAAAEKPYRGNVDIRGKICVVPQDPQMLFVSDTVLGELYDISTDENEIENIIKLCGLEGLEERHPYDLSGGEQQKLAMAKVLLTKPEILAADEPTKGLDADFKETLAAIFKYLKQCGMTIITVSHDIEFCAKCADRCAMLFDGKIIAEGNTREFFADGSFYSTCAAKMSRGIIDGAVTAKDIIQAIGGREEKEKNIGIDIKIDFNNKNPSGHEGKKQKKKIFSFFKNDKFNVSPSKRKYKKTSTAVLIISIALILMTIFVGVLVFGDRKYYIISMLLIAETMLPFFTLFEWKRPGAKETVIISVLCAIAVASRVLFFMLPQIKPILAVVMISGIAFGGETGFLVGAVSAFVSNFFFGQGPWTPWQMFAMGMSGFFAGIIFGRIRCGRIRVAAIGAVITFIVYGGVMNLSSLMMYQTDLTKEMILSVYAAGAPFDAIHAAGVFVFLYIIAKPMTEKLERIKMKYGLVNEK